MKKALYLALALIGATTAAIAQQGTPPAGGDKGGQSFEQRKAQMLKRMEERMQTMQKSHDCLVPRLPGAGAGREGRARMPSDGQNRRAHGRRRPHGARRALSRCRSRHLKLAEA